MPKAGSRYFAIIRSDAFCVEPAFCARIPHAWGFRYHIDLSVHSDGRTYLGSPQLVKLIFFDFHDAFPFSSSRFNALYSAKVIPLPVSFAGMSRLL